MFSRGHMEYTVIINKRAPENAPREGGNVYMKKKNCFINAGGSTCTFSDCLRLRRK